ncbi:hypothetical protein BDA99DRAFT_569412 [Phascolomyces articulosus]|uniref:Uncharacterized protein n=1 Tax=Phascolomyces articulosus TaxID=60185 RepID=A0AAD5KHS9_9FUNG|nr:hypothetical protein BDA99DRAFT_569412 [Phascolomyces articulosus]
MIQHPPKVETNNGDSGGGGSGWIKFSNCFITTTPAIIGHGLEPVNPLQMSVPPRHEHSYDLRNIFYYGSAVGIISLCNCSVPIDAHGGGDFSYDCNRYCNSTYYMVSCAGSALFACACFVHLLHSFTRRDLRNSAWVPSYFLSLIVLSVVPLLKSTSSSNLAYTLT